MKLGISIGLLLLLFAAQTPAADPAHPDTPADASSAPSPAPKCQFIPLKLANPADYYPDKERKAGHAARVLVEFLPTDSGKLVDVVVVGPSPYPALNDAALRVMENTRLKPTCPGKRVTWAIQFGPAPAASGH